MATGKSAITDASGNVTFANLVPGSYEVAVVTPTGAPTGGGPPARPRPPPPPPKFAMMWPGPMTPMWSTFRSST